MNDTNDQNDPEPNTGADDERLSARARELFAKEHAALIEATPQSRRLFERAQKSLPLGVASSFQAADPYPIYLARGLGAEVWDIDGRELLRLPQRLRVDRGRPRPSPRSWPPSKARPGPAPSSR